MKEIKYEVDGIGACTTPCPFGKRFDDKEPVYVGSALCNSCPFYGSKAGDFVICKFNDIKSFNDGQQQPTANQNLTSTSAVNHPSHYNQGGIECIDAILAARGLEATKEFCICNAMKYLWRLGHKDDAVQEAKKAKWYLDKYIELCCK